MRISDWSSDVCSSDLLPPRIPSKIRLWPLKTRPTLSTWLQTIWLPLPTTPWTLPMQPPPTRWKLPTTPCNRLSPPVLPVAKTCRNRASFGTLYFFVHPTGNDRLRSEEHTSELQSLMRISYAVFCLKKKKTQKNYN